MNKQSNTKDLAIQFCKLAQISQKKMIIREKPKPTKQVIENSTPKDLSIAKQPPF